MDSPEPFEAFEDRHPELVAIDHDGRVRNKIDLFEKERKENSELTRAREVSPGFWVRPSFCYPLVLWLLELITYGLLSLAVRWATLLTVRF